MWLATEIAAVGLIAGLLSALLGLGGGIFIVPALTTLCGLPIRTAVAASLMGVIATSTGVGCFTHPGRAADLGLAMRLEVATAAGALAGSVLAGFAPARLVSGAFALIVVATAAHMVLKARMVGTPTSGEAYRVTNWPAGLAASVVAGLVSGLTGVGGGFIKVPVMHAVMDVPFHVATATSSFMVGITAAASVLVYMSRGDMHPLVAAPVCLGALAGAAVGGFISPRIAVEPLRRILFVILVIVAVDMAWNAFRDAPG